MRVALCSRHSTHLPLLIAALVLCCSAVSRAQPTYSIDYQGPTAPALVSEGDILTISPASPLPPPLVVIPAGAGGLGLSMLHSHRELDALSYGLEFPLQPDLPPLTFYEWQFSVDEFAVGLTPVPPSSVTSEGAFGSMEAAADIYGSLTPPGPVPVGIGGNVGIWDGNGVPPFGGPSLNLVEPNPPTPMSVPDPGDNLDAWDFDTPVTPAGDIGTPLPFATFFSLDARFADPLEAGAGPPPNTATAAANGFVGGDVAVTTVVGGPPSLYADSRLLGLNGGMPTPDPNQIDEDDLDALVLWDNGNLTYDPVTGPYSWIPTPVGIPTDMLLFSVRRGSAIIGTPDAILGIPIEESDVLVPVMTGPGTWLPGIFVPGEVLGLVTLRSGAVPFSPDGITFFADDLDALDVTEVVIPEPTSLLLALTAVGGIATLRRR